MRSVPSALADVIATLFLDKKEPLIPRLRDCYCYAEGSKYF